MCYLLSLIAENPSMVCWMEAGIFTWLIVTQWPPLKLNIFDSLLINYAVIKDTSRNIYAGNDLYFMTWWTWSSHIESHISQYHSLLASLLLVFLSAWTNSWSCLTTVTAFRPRCPIITAFLNIATFCFGEWLTKVIRIICTGSCSCLAASIASFRTIWPWALT